MKALITFTAILFSFSNLLNGQTRTLYGHVIDDDLVPLPGVFIKAGANQLIGKTDFNGRFKIDIPQSTQSLSLILLGYEKATIKLAADCDTIELVMMASGTYDFMSSRKIDKDRLNRFNKLTEVYLKAYQTGIFQKASVCYTREFEPEKPSLDSIAKEEIKEEKQIKLTFKKLAIGDTVKIPFSSAYKEDGTNRYKLSYYSVFADMGHYECIIKCIITGKNKHKKGYNLLCKVVNCDLCEYPSVLNGRVMKIGEGFSYNMKYFKILGQ